MQDFQKEVLSQGVKIVHMQEVLAAEFIIIHDISNQNGAPNKIVTKHAVN